MPDDVTWTADQFRFACGTPVCRGERLESPACPWGWVVMDRLAPGGCAFTAYVGGERAHGGSCMSWERYTRDQFVADRLDQYRPREPDPTPADNGFEAWWAEHPGDGSTRDIANDAWDYAYRQGSAVIESPAVPTWTAAPPTAGGLYWLRRPDAADTVALVESPWQPGEPPASYLALPADDCRVLTGWLRIQRLPPGSLWAGPIRPPGGSA